MISREGKEEILRQKSVVIWLTGLSGAGKTTLARGLEWKLHQRGHLVQVLDGDVVRNGLNNDLDYSVENRRQNIRRVAEMAKLMLNNGIIVICSFITPTSEIRALARGIIGEKDFYCVFVNAPLAVCESRDIKGLYRKARQGEITDFTGINSPYEEPTDCQLELKTSQLTIDEAVDELMREVLPRIQYNQH